MATLKLQSIDASRLHHAEFGQFIIRFFEDFEKSGLELTKDTDFTKVK